MDVYELLDIINDLIKDKSITRHSQIYFENENRDIFEKITFVTHDEDGDLILKLGD